jgi:hypothetical protein
MRDRIVENVLNKYISRSNVGINKILSIGKHIQELIKENPNDTELGTKIRQIYGLNDKMNE